VTGQRFKTICANNAVAAIRARDFLARHGRPGIEELREGESEDGRRGCWEMHAADGYRLRCEWVRGDDEEQFTFSEIAPGAENR
jgi:hypothetical protein